MHDAQLVHAELVSIARQRDRLQCRQARLLVLAEQLEIWRHFGCAHIYDYLERHCDLQPRTAREYVRVARALATLPQMRDKLEAEEVRYSVVRELTRIATPDTEAEWLRETADMTAREVEDAVAGRERGDRPHDPRDPDRLVTLSLQVRESTYAMFVDVRMKYVDEQGERLSDDDLVIALCRGATDGAEVGVDAADASVVQIPPYRLSLSTCRSCRKTFQITAGRELEVPASTVALVRCDARDIGDVESDLPQRARSSVTPRLREQVIVRDHFMCTVPGCRSTRHLDVHHIEEQAEGGDHVASNVTTTCGLCRARHNEHYAGYAVMPGSDGLSTTTKSAARHNQRLFRNVSSASSGRNRPVVTCSGAVRFRAPSFIARSASRYICVVSMDS